MFRVGQHLQHQPLHSYQSTILQPPEILSYWIKQEKREKIEISKGQQIDQCIIMQYFIEQHFGDECRLVGTSCKQHPNDRNPEKN
jgi:hypothetical protein